jgi:hypothetical protein
VQAGDENCKRFLPSPLISKDSQSTCNGNNALDTILLSDMETLSDTLFDDTLVSEASILKAPKAVKLSFDFPHTAFHNERSQLEIADSLLSTLMSSDNDEIHDSESHTYFSEAKTPVTVGLNFETDCTLSLQKYLSFSNEEAFSQGSTKYDIAKANNHNFETLNHNDQESHSSGDNYLTADDNLSDINSVYSSHEYDDDDLWSESVCSMSDDYSDDFSDDDIPLPEPDDNDILPISGELPFAGCISPLPFGRLSDHLNRLPQSTSTNTNLHHPYKDMVRLFRNPNKDREAKKKSQHRVAFKMPATPPASPINR